MTEVTLIGVDLAKRVFQLHGAAADGTVLFRKTLTRPQFERFMAEQARCTVAMEACATAHHWGRVLSALGFDVRLLPPVHVKPFVKRQKNDRNDAQAITEAAQRPGLYPVPVKTVEAQALTMLLRTRDQLVSQRTDTINALRGHLAEFGIIAPAGTRHLPGLERDLEAACLPELVRELAAGYFERIAALEERIAALTAQIAAHTRRSAKARRLTTMPGLGPVTAITIEAFAPAMTQFARGRDFAAWLGLVPRQHSSGGKARLGRCSKMGQRDIRRLLIVGAMSVIAQTKRHGRCDDPWLKAMLARKPRMVVAVALANRMARRVWAMLTKDENYAAPVTAA